MSDRVPVGLRVLMGVLFLARMAAAGLVAIVAFQVYEITGRELDLGLLGLAQFIPVFFLSPFTGSLADQFDRRRVFAVGLAVEMFVALGMAWLSLGGLTTAGPVFVLMLVYGVAKALEAPASRSLPIDLAPGHMVNRVVALKSSFALVGSILGPLIGAFLYARAPQLPYFFMAAISLLAIVGLGWVPRSSVVAMRRLAKATDNIRQAFDGLRFIRHSRLVRAVITLDLFAVLLGGAVALLPAIAEQRLGVGAVGYGWLRAALGIGAFVTSTTLAIRPMRRHAGRKMLIAVAIFGVMTIVLGLTTNFVVAFVALVVMAGADAVSVLVRSALVPLATPPDMRGRVLAVENVFIGGSNELGAVESGLVGEWLGASLAVITGGIGTLLVVGLWWRFFPSLRQVDRIEDVRPTQAVTDP